MIGQASERSLLVVIGTIILDNRAIVLFTQFSVMPYEISTLASNHAFPILYLISLNSRIRWIQLESVKHD